MRRLFVAVAVVTGCAAVAQAGSLPKAVRLVDRMKVYGSTHYVRGSQGSGGGGGSSASSTAEARSQAPASQKAPQPRPTPQPAKAD